MCHTYNFEIVAEDIFARTMTVTTEDGTPYPLDAYEDIAMQVRRSPGTDVITEGSTGSGNITVSGVDNNILEISGIEIPADATGVYMYDIEFSAPGVRETLIRGRITVIPQITITGA